MKKLDKFLILSVIICIISVIYSGFMSEYYVLFGLTKISSQFHVALPNFIILFVIIFDMIVIAFNDVVYGGTNVN